MLQVYRRLNLAFCEVFHKIANNKTHVGRLSIQEKLLVYDLVLLGQPRTLLLRFYVGDYLGLIEAFEVLAALYHDWSLALLALVFVLIHLFI